VETFKPILEPPKANNQEELITLIDSPKTDALELIRVNKSSVPRGAITSSIKQKDYNINKSSRVAKRVKALITILIIAKISKLKKKIKELVFITIRGRIDIIIPKTYKEAILDKEYSKE
jgi:hypothetical protein